MGGGATRKYIRKAQVILNATARWVTGKPRRTRTRELMKDTGWFTIVEQVKIATATFTWKLVHLKKPARLLQRMRILNDYKIEVVDPRLQISQRAYRWRAGVEWNLLPQDMRQEQSLGCFKRKLKKLVLQDRNWDPGV